MKVESSRRHTPRTYKVTLTEGEVDALLALVVRTSGHPVKSPRKYYLRIYDALAKAAGYGYRDTDACPLMLGTTFVRRYGERPFTQEEEDDFFRGSRIMDEVQEEVQHQFDEVILSV